MNWKETVLFQNFPVQQVSNGLRATSIRPYFSVINESDRANKQIHRMALEVSIWLFDEAPRLSTQMPQAICETLIRLQEARERNTDFWPLRAPPCSPQTRRKSLNDLIGE